MKIFFLSLTVLLLAGCGADEVSCTKDNVGNCAAVGCKGDDDCTGDQVCFQRDGSGIGRRCEKNCDDTNSFCAAEK